MRVDARVVDEFWRDVLLDMVGGQSPLVGVRCIAKTPLRIETWYSDDVKSHTVRAWLQQVIGRRAVQIYAHKVHSDILPGAVH